MATSRVDLNGTTLIDISDTTAVATDVAQDKTFYAANGVKTTGTASGGMNTQVCISMDYVNTNTYTVTDITLKCAKAGKYTISWMGFRNTSSGTSGSALYINGTQHTAVTSFTRTYGQSITLTNISLQKDDVLTLYARARNSSYYMYVGNLIIQQTA